MRKKLTIDTIPDPFRISHYAFISRWISYKMKRGISRETKAYSSSSNLFPGLKKISCSKWYKIGTKSKYWYRKIREHSANSGFCQSIERIVGNNNTSRIAGLFVSSITSLSIPYPIPPVGGIPISRAFMKSSSVVLASSSPAARAASCA